MEKEILYDYADGLLDEATAKEVEKAIDNDDALKAQLYEIQSFNAILKADSLAAPNIDFSQKLMAAWAAEQVAAPVVAETPFVANYRPLRILGGILSAFFVILLIVVIKDLPATSTTFDMSFELPNLDFSHQTLRWTLLLLFAISSALFMEKIVLHWYWLKSEKVSL